MKSDMGAKKDVRENTEVEMKSWKWGEKAGADEDREGQEVYLGKKGGLGPYNGVRAEVHMESGEK